MSDAQTTAPTPDPAVKPSAPTRTGDTVTVACKLPGGLILRVFEMETYTEAMRDGSFKEMQRAVPVDELQYVIRGPWLASGGQAFRSGGGMVDEILPGGYALTRGVPRETWERWKKANERSALVRNNIVFAHKSEDSVNQEARKNFSGVKTGLEPIDPKDPAARVPGGIDRRLKFGVLKDQDAA